MNIYALDTALYLALLPIAIKAFIYIEAQKRSTLVQLSRYINNKLIPPAIIVISIQLVLLASASSLPEAIYYILSLTNLNSDLPYLSQRFVLLYSPYAS